MPNRVARYVHEGLIEISYSLVVISIHLPILCDLIRIGPSIDHSLTSLTKCYLRLAIEVVKLVLDLLLEGS